MYQAMYPMRYAFAAGCFMLPGFFSDLVGLLLLIPLSYLDLFSTQPLVFITL